MKRLFLCSVFSLSAILIYGQTQKNNSLADKNVKQHKSYGNNRVKKIKNIEHKQKKKKHYKASSMMDTLGDKPNTNEPDK
ncbi:MAG: hypothetical protein ACTHJ0_15140 [Flavipsychrobacter sp.]